MDTQWIYIEWQAWRDMGRKEPLIWKLLDWIGDEHLMLLWAGFAKWEEIGVSCWIFGHKQSDHANLAYCVRCGMPKVIQGI